MEKMKLEAVVVCINYSDFLTHTLPYNKGMFDRIVVVTNNEDKETAKVCEKWNVMCVKTEALYKDDSKVPTKAMGINEGLKNLKLDGWVVQLDADIWLPPFFRAVMEQSALDETCIYSMDRFMCNSYKQWYKFTHIDKRAIMEGWTFLRMDTMEVGSRLVHHRDGYMPIGFFQMWHPKTSKIYTYPDHIVGYDRTDVLHARQFTRAQRKLIPDCMCVHLASETHKQGQNWKGRKTIPFGQIGFGKRVLFFINIRLLLVTKFLKWFFSNRPSMYSA